MDTVTGYIQRARLPLLTCLFIFTSHSTVSAEELVLQSGNEQNTLIELYTSQGCNSCPPAEKWLSGLQTHPDLWKKLIPIAFHVDYWDYLGWQDKLARPAFSQRQRQYAREKGLSTVYTPGFLVNGKEWRRWFGLRKLPDSNAMTGVLTVKLKGDAINASYQPGTPLNGKLRLNIAILGVGISTDITRGENAGKVLPQDFSVLSFKQVDTTNRTWKTTLPQVANKTGARLAVAAWISSGERLSPLQAVGGWLTKDRISP